MISEQCPDELSGRRLVSLDIETTGLDQRFNTIIEFGFVEYVGGKPARSGAWLFGGGHSPMHLVRTVHHITDRERRGRKRFSERAGEIHDLLDGAVIITYNGNSFDLPMIRRHLAEAGHPLEQVKSIDVLQLVRKMRKKEDLDDGKDDGDRMAGRNRLGNVCREFGVQYGGDDGGRAHRGMEDSEACLALLFKLVSEKRVAIGRI
jgi:DNA polymerase III epsilon subunit-like protein